MIIMVFFSKNKQTAMKRVRNLAKEDPYYKGKKVKLAKKQIPHDSNWKTWQIVKKAR